MSDEGRFVFALTSREADALIELVNGVSSWTKRNSPIDRAADKLDEQKAQQVTRFEGCPSCGGSGWIEAGEL